MAIVVLLWVLFRLAVFLWCVYLTLVVADYVGAWPFGNAWPLQ